MAQSKLKSVEDLVSELNSNGACEDPIFLADGKGKDGRRKYAVVFSDERWRFKIPRERVLSEHLEFVCLAAPSPYDIVQDQDVEVARCRLSVGSVQGVVAAFPERAKAQLLRLNLDGPIEQLLDGVEEQASKVSNLALEALEFDRRPILQVEASYGYVSVSGPLEAKMATKEKSKEARIAASKGPQYVDAGPVSGPVTKEKTRELVKNLPGAAHESHWVDITVLSIRSLDVEIAKKYTKLSCKVECKNAEEKVMHTAWAVSPFHTEQVKQAATQMNKRGLVGKGANTGAKRSRHTLDYLSRGKSTIDMGAVYLELARQGEHVQVSGGGRTMWNRFLRLILGQESANRIIALLSSEEEEYIRKERQLDHALWRRFARDTEADGASLSEHKTVVKIPDYIINPHSNKKIAWDSFMLFLVCYTIFGLPYQVAFGTSFLPTKYSGGNSTQHMNPLYVYTQEEEDPYISLSLLCNRPPAQSEDEKWAPFGMAIFGGKCSIEDMWFIAHTCMDALLMLDVCLTFRTAFPTHNDPIQVLARQKEQFETNPNRIAVKYLHGWFWLDFFSALPIDLIMWALATHTAQKDGGDGSSPVVRSLKAVKLGKAARIVRFRKLASFASQIQSEVNRRKWKLATMACVYVLLSHWAACGVAYISDPSISPLARMDLEYGRAYNGQTWLELMDIATVHPFQKYTRALYFATQTIALVGDGGIEFRLPGEISYAILTTWAGIIFMLYATTQVLIMVSAANEEESRYLVHVGRIRFYCQSRGLPMELQRQMLEHAAWRWRTTNMLDEEALTHDLSGGLQQSVTMFRAIGMVSRMPFFQGMDSECVRTVVACLRTQHFIGSDIVARQSDICTGCYYLFAGSVALVTHQAEAAQEDEDEEVQDRAEVKGNTEGGGKGKIKKTVKQGELLGEEALLREWRWDLTLQALSCCEVQILLRSDFLEILDMFPHELDRCQRLANHLWPASPFEGPQGQQANRKLHMQPPVASPLRTSEGPREAIGTPRLATGLSSIETKMKTPAARGSSAGGKLQQGASGMLAASQTEAMQDMVREATAPLEVELISLRKQVVQLQLQLAQGFQEHREEMRLLLREHLQDSNARDARMEFSTHVSDHLKGRSIARSQDAQPVTLRSDSRSIISPARNQDGGKTPGPMEAGVVPDASGRGAERAQEWAEKVQVGRIQWGLQPLPDLGQYGGEEGIDESGVFKVGWTTRAGAHGGGNDDTASTISENDSPPITPRAGNDASGRKSKSMKQQSAAGRKAFGGPPHRDHEQIMPIFRSQGESKRAVLVDYR